MSLEKFSSQAESHLLAELKNLARTEGKQMQALINEAFADLIEKHKQTKPRRRVVDAFQASLEKYDSVYDTLAK